MKIDKLEYKRLSVYDISVTVPDSFVSAENKTGKGHGEAKFYMGSKTHMREFYADDPSSSKFKVRCVILKKDLLEYMSNIKHEYYHPSIQYRGINGKSMASLWKKRYSTVNALPEALFFDIKDQAQIKGPRGYVKSCKRKEEGYELLRDISLPFVSYVSVMKLENKQNGERLFYWKLFADYSQMAEMQYAAKNYGKRKNLVTRRKGQTKYRQGLLDLYSCCPFTKIDDEKLLIASHIKPWAICNVKEKNDVNNGFILSPLYDKLFDKGFITFDNDGSLEISDWLSEENVNRIDFSKYEPARLQLTPERIKYLEFHRQFVFKR
jgi:putative restriction endonuclease